MKRVSLILLGTAVLLATISFAATSETDGQLIVPPHSPSQLAKPFSYSRAVNTLNFLRAASEQGRDGVFRLPDGFRYRNDPMAFGRTVDNTCYKLRKYVFSKPTEMRGDESGAVPLNLSNESVLVGETDCTYANRIRPHSAQGPDPSNKGNRFGLSSAVVKSH